jgi:hypothetical protein
VAGADSPRPATLVFDEEDVWLALVEEVVAIDYREELRAEL